MIDEIHNIANYLHVLAIVALLMKIWCTQNCSGISGKTQFLYALVYTTRYLDLFTVYVSNANTVGKILYLLLGYFTTISIYILFRKTHEKEYDTFRIEILVIPCMIIALLINHEFSPLEILWTFSIYLEAVAILPQFHFIAKAKFVHKHVFYYILAIGIYKCLYIAHWTYQFYYHNRYDNLTVASGIVQFVLYCDFFTRVVPYLKNRNDNRHLIVNIENGGVNSAGHLNCNISTIVLTPESLVNQTDDKVNLLKNDEENMKY